MPYHTKNGTCYLLHFCIIAQIETLSCPNQMLYLTADLPVLIKKNSAMCNNKIRWWLILMLYIAFYNYSYAIPVWNISFDNKKHKRWEKIISSHHLLCIIFELKQDINHCHNYRHHYHKSIGSPSLSSIVILIFILLLLLLIIITTHPQHHNNQLSSIPSSSPPSLTTILNIIIINYYSHNHCYPSLSIIILTLTTITYHHRQHHYYHHHHHCNHHHRHC